MLTGSNPLLVLSVVLIAGVSCGALAKQCRLPAVTGQILVGILLGPSVVHLFDSHSVEGLRPLAHFALGLIAVAIGSHLNLKRLRNAKLRLAWLLLCEITVTPLLVFLAVGVLPGATWTLALLLAMISISTAPATIVALVKETRAKGVFVKTLVAAVALNNIACICLFAFAQQAVAASLSPDHAHGVTDVLLAPFRVFFGSAVLGGGMGLLLILATWKVMRSDRLATFSMIAILFTAGLADYLKYSSLLSCLFLGMTLANLTPNKEEIGHGVFANFETAILATFFTLAGMELDFQYALPAGLTALAVVAARLGGKVMAGRIAMKLAHATPRIQQNLGMALTPQAGVAVGLILLAQDDPALESISKFFLAVGITVVTINEIIGPVLTRLGLQRSGDAGKDRPRLMDFLHEENIITDMRAASKEDAIRQLVDLLIRSHNLKVDRKRFLHSVMVRESEISTCVGEGLAIPHGVLEDGDRILGVMGLSREGLTFETPDNELIHCMVLLATPPTHRERHLQVIAALARALRADRGIQLQLYGATSPAHAYELLHTEDTQDFNYFLEEPLRA